MVFYQPQLSIFFQMPLQIDKSKLANKKYKHLDQMQEQPLNNSIKIQQSGKENDQKRVPPCQEAGLSKRKMIKKAVQKRGRPKKITRIPLQGEENRNEPGELAEVTIDGFYNQDTPLEKLCKEIQFILIDFFNEIKEEKGFVYTEEYRNKLAKSKKIVWSKMAIWDQATQVKKIKSRYNDFDLEEDPNMTELLLKVSEIFAQEFTNELYTIILEVYLMDVQDQESQEEKQASLIQFAEDIYHNKDDKFYLFSLQFRAQVKPSKKMLFQKPNDPSAYIRLVKGLYRQLQKMIDL